MKEPYTIGLRGSQGPVSIVVNAPMIEVTPHHWKTRIAWAWRMLRGRSLPVAPSVNIIENILTTEEPKSTAISVNVLRHLDDDVAT